MLYTTKKHHWTLMIVLKLRNDIEKAVSSGKVTLSIFADYFKAFVPSFLKLSHVLVVLRFA